LQKKNESFFRQKSRVEKKQEKEFGLRTPLTRFRASVNARGFKAFTHFGPVGYDSAHCVKPWVTNTQTPQK
jgi:hypothetical protein